MVEIDAPRLAVAFGRALRAAGVPTTPERAARLVRALELVAPLDGSRVYWAARATLLSAPEQIPAFERVFAGAFGGVSDVAAAARGPSPMPSERGAAEGGGRAPLLAAWGESRRKGDPEGVAAIASAVERRGTRSFDPLTAAERARRMRLSPPPWRSRRTRRAAHGRRIDLRATLRRSLRTAGEPARLARRRRRLRPRPVVLLCDISGSMEPYSRALIGLMQSAVASGTTEAFVFATRLTRLTRALRGADPDAAIARAAALPPDWSGGTRIAAALKAFTDRHGRRGMARGAVVVIVSDGWERGEPEALGREVERLSRLAHRIVWINPRAGAPGFAPLAAGMAAALPHVDALAGVQDLPKVLATAC
jgi:uncharacterized protein with von Willebrand factor type A (vWA) domain